MLTWKEKDQNLAPIPVHCKKAFYEEIWYLEANAEQQNIKQFLMIMTLMG